MITYNISYLIRRQRYKRKASHLYNEMASFVKQVYKCIFFTYSEASEICKGTKDVKPSGLELRTI